MQKRTIYVVMLTTLMAFFMFGFCFALVPVYKSYCRVLGINKLPTVSEYESTPDLTRSITVEFVATNNADLPWTFYPKKNSIKVHPAENNKIIFYARNNSNKPMTVQAIPSYAPNISAQYFHKLECFCFRQQTLNPGEEKNMPVIFRLNKNIPTEIHTITLAYSLFDVTPETA